MVHLGHTGARLPAVRVMIQPAVNAGKHGLVRRTGLMGPVQRTGLAGQQHDLRTLHSWLHFRDLESQVRSHGDALSLPVRSQGSQTRSQGSGCGSPAQDQGPELGVTVWLKPALDQNPKPGVT